MYCLKKKWIVHSTNRNEAKVNLLMFVYAGGSPSFFAPWKKYFDAYVNVCPVLYPGREIRKSEPIPASVEEMVGEFVDDASELFEKPVVLFGQCTGSIIAYEAAKCIYKKYGCFPLAFVTSSMNSPRSYDCYKALYDNDGNEATDAVLAERMVEQGTVSADFAKDQNFINYYMPVFRGDLKMFEHIDKSDPMKLGCNIYCLTGTEDEFVTESGVADWKNYTSKSAFYEQVHGGHYYFNEYGNKEFVLARLNTYIKNNLGGI